MSDPHSSLSVSMGVSLALSPRRCEAQTLFPSQEKAACPLSQTEMPQVVLNYAEKHLSTDSDVMKKSFAVGINAAFTKFLTQEGGGFKVGPFVQGKLCSRTRPSLCGSVDLSLHTGGTLLDQRVEMDLLSATARMSVSLSYPLTTSSVADLKDDSPKLSIFAGIDNTTGLSVTPAPDHVTETGAILQGSVALLAPVMGVNLLF